MTTNSNPNTVAEMQSTTDQQASTADPFNPTNLRLSQSFVETAGIRKLLTNVQCVSQVRKILFGFTPTPRTARTSPSLS